jgi:hypothetical protein
MKEFELNDEAVIDLGQASVETKGAAILLADDDGSPRVFAMGIVND